MNSQISDSKLVKFYYSTWKLGPGDFCKEYNDDVVSFSKFLNGIYDSERSRENLKKFWEKHQTSRLGDQSDDDDDEFSNTFGDNNLNSQLSPIRNIQSPPSANRGLGAGAPSAGQTTATTGAGGGGGKDNKRVRNLLKTYYGAGIGENEPTVNDPMNIDGPSFNLNTYFENIIKSSTLPQLIAKDNEMVSEIRTLDGDMKTLVYDNYTKFINATDIIKKMKTNVENMEEGMELLSKNMDLITTCSEKINSTLSVRRDRIDQLSGLQKLLKKLQFLTALPSRLNHCLEMQAFNQAVNYYNSNSGILKQYNHIPSFQNIQTECDEIMKNMKVKLYERLSSVSTPKSDVVESAEILMNLLEPVEKVRSQYLQSRKLQTLDILSSLEKREVNNITDYISDLNKCFLSEYEYNTSSFKSLFINRFDGSDSNRERKQSSLQLDDFSKELFNRYLAIAKVKLSSFKDPEQKIKALEIIFSDVSKLSNSDLTSFDKINDIINSSVHDQISYYFENLQTTIKNQIYNMNNILNTKKEEALEGNFLLELSESTSKAIIQDISLLFKNLKPFFLPTETSFLSRHYGTIFTKIQVKLQQFFLFLVNIHFVEYLDIIATTPNKEQFSPRFLLVLTSICLYIENKGIGHVVQLMNEFISTVKQGINSQDMNILSFNAPDLCKRIRETGQTILTSFARLKSQKTEKILKKGLESVPNWLVLKEPRDVRPVIDILLEELSGVSKEVSKLLPTTSQTLNTHASRAQGHHRTSSSNSNSNTPTDIRKNTSNTNLSLFDKKVDLYSQVDFNVNSVMIGIIKLTLKSFMECLRLKTFGTNGYHQIQIDLQYLRMILNDMFGGNNSFEYIIQDCESTITERCLDPIPLAKSITQKICETKFQKRNQPNDNE